MPDVQQERLLDRILSSRQFAHAESLQRVLRYVCVPAGDEGKEAIREHDVAVHTLGRADGFDVKSDPIVRVSVAAIRERLRSYFETDGVHEPIRLHIPVAGLRAVFTTTSEAESGSGTASGILDFWRCYLASGASNVLVYAEVLFFRDERYHYVRNIFVNDAANGEEELTARFPEVDFSSFLPSYHFAPAGEMHCVLFLTKQFQDLGARLEVRTARQTAWNELRKSNLIFIGSARTNSLVQSLQGEQPFVLTEESIVNRLPKIGEPPEFVSRRYREGKLRRLTEFALVTRQGGLSPDTCTTMISANHGRAIEAAGHYLTRADTVRELLGILKEDAGEALPVRFQVLLQVEMVDCNEDVVSVEYLTHRVF